MYLVVPKFKFEYAVDPEQLSDAIKDLGSEIFKEGAFDGWSEKGSVNELRKRWLWART